MLLRSQVYRPETSKILQKNNIFHYFCFQMLRTRLRTWNSMFGGVRMVSQPRLPTSAENPLVWITIVTSVESASNGQSLPNLCLY